jgi:hypothetical protein
LWSTVKRETACPFCLSEEIQPTNRTMNNKKDRSDFTNEKDNSIIYSKLQSYATKSVTAQGSLRTAAEK